MKTYYSQSQRRRVVLTAEKVWTGYCWLNDQSSAEEIARSDEWGHFWENQSRTQKDRYCQMMSH